jgi:hypothetical protein
MFKGMVAFIALCFTVSLAADQNLPAFYFGGHRLFVGMPKTEAVAALSDCCKLSPPADSENDKADAHTDSHFIVSKQESSQGMFGTILFVDGKVARITRALDDKLDNYSDDAVALARALDRSLLRDTNGSSVTVVVSEEHERASNADAEILSLTFPNGRSIEMQIVTLDTPDKATGKRDSVTLDEVLQ